MLKLIFYNKDIHLYNAAGSKFDTRIDGVNVVLYNTGDIHYLPPFQFETFCPHKLNQDNELVCSFKFGRFRD